MIRERDSAQAHYQTGLFALTLAQELRASGLAPEGVPAYVAALRAARRLTGPAADAAASHRAHLSSSPGAAAKNALLAAVSLHGALAADGPPTTHSGTGTDRILFAQGGITRDTTRFVNGTPVGARDIFNLDQSVTCPRDLNDAWYSGRRHHQSIRPNASEALASGAAALPRTRRPLPFVRV